MHKHSHDLAWPSVFADAVQINAPVEKVWKVISDPEHMQRWMLDETVEVSYAPTIGAPIIIRGSLHGDPFENRGNVTVFDPPSRFGYTHLSSISALPDVPESYSTLNFHCVPLAQSTRLTLEISNFPTASIYHHLAFYWKVTLHVIKNMAEKH